MNLRVVFEIRLRAPAKSARGRVFEAHPELVQETTTFALERPPVSVSWSRLAGPAAAVEAMLAAMREDAGREMTLTVHYRAHGEAVFTAVGPPYGRPRRRGWQRRVEAVAWRALGQDRYFVERLTGQGRVATWVLVTDHERALPEFLRQIAESCARDDRDFRVVSIGPYAPNRPAAPALTRRQREALLAAWDAGYYAGRARVADVAAQVGMSASGLHGLLSRAERVVLGEAVKALAARPEASPPPSPERRRRAPRS